MKFLESFEKVIFHNRGEIGFEQPEDRNKLSILIDGASKEDINEVNRDGKNALIHSIYLYDLEISKQIIEKGADINYVFEEKSILLICFKAKNFGLFKYLIQIGADVTHRGPKNEWDLLSCCCSHVMYYNGVIESIKLLLEKGKDIINIEDKKGRNAFYYFCICDTRRNKEIFDLFVKNGAILQEKYLLESIDLRNVNDIYVIEHMINTMKDVNMQNIRKNTILHLFCLNCAPSHKEKMIETIKILRKRGININTENARGFSPLMLSILILNKDLVTLLLENDAIISIKKLETLQHFFFANDHPRSDSVPYSEKNKWLFEEIIKLVRTHMNQINSMKKCIRINRIIANTTKKNNIKKVFLNLISTQLVAPYFRTKQIIEIIEFSRNLKTLIQKPNELFFKLIKNQ